MPRPPLLRMAFPLVLLAISATGAPGAESRPNVVVILADDQGWGDLGAHGNTNLKTPNLDGLARDGAMFERFYVCPVCAPTRAELLTGRYHPRGGVRGVSTGLERLDLDETTIAQVFQRAGYSTAIFGKWHNGTQYPYHPNARGFEEFYGFCSGHWGDYFDPPLEHNGKIVRGKGYITDDLTDHAIDFVKSRRDRPFFCYLALNTPHSPMQVPDRFLDRFKDAPITQRYPGPQPENIENTRVALAMVENIDWNVGRLLDTIDSEKLADHTIIVYFSDNGPAAWRWNGGMKGRKGTTDEGGVRSPLLVRWPRRIQPGTRIGAIAGAIDLAPTLAELAGVSGFPRPLDGKSLAPALLAKGDPPTDRILFTHWAGRVSARSQRYRLDEAGNLFEMERDPGQTRDVSAENPSEAQRLREAVANWRRDVLSEMKGDDRPYPVGHAAFPVTYLPARDGVPHGGIRRSAAAPNCSYFTNWTSTGDRMTWDIEVATAGTYEAVVYYTCSPGNEGSLLELALGDRRVRGRVAEAHDPPAIGAEHDRVPRQGESLVKEFRPLSLGEIALERGRGLLTLRALEIPGKAVAEARMVVLTLRTR